MSKIIKITIFAETRKKLGKQTIQRKHCWDVFAHAHQCAPKMKPARHSGCSAVYTQTLVCFILLTDSNQYFSATEKIIGILKGNNTDSQEDKCLWVTLRNSPSGPWDSENSRVAQPCGTVLGLLPELEESRKCKHIEDGSHFSNHSFDVLNFSFDSTCFLLVHFGDVWNSCQRMTRVP